MLNILVLIKIVPDPALIPHIAPEKDQLDASLQQSCLNPYDEIALAAALDLRDQGLDCDITVISVTAPEHVERLRQALALGADHAIAITHQGELSALATAHLIASAARQNPPDLLLLGQQASDEENGTLAPLLATLLDWPLAMDVTQLQVKEAIAQVETSTGDLLQTLELTLPAVVSCDLLLTQPRFAKLMAIAAARRRPIMQEQAPSTAQRSSACLLAEPPARPPCTMHSDLDHFAAALQQALEETPQ